MAVKFPLEMKDGVQVRNISELKENFDVERIVGYFLDGKLKKWLDARWYEDESEAVSKLDESDSLLTQHLCEIFGMKYEAEEINLEEIVARNARISKLKQYTDDEEIIKNVDAVAFNQEELAKLYDKRLQKIYLCEGIFSIPKPKKEIEYKMLGNVVIEQNTEMEENQETNICVSDEENYVCEYSGYECKHIKREIPQELLDYIGNKDCVNLEEYIVWCDYDGSGPSSYDYDYKIVPFFNDKNISKMNLLDRYKVWNKQLNMYSSLFKIGENGYRLGFEGYKNQIIYRDLEGICVYDVVSATRECIYKDLSNVYKEFSVNNSVLSFRDSAGKVVDLNLNDFERKNDEKKEYFNVELWKKIKDYVRTEWNLSEVSFVTWIEPLQVVCIQENKIYLETPIGTEYIEKKYGAIIKEAIDKFTKNDFGVIFVKKS